MVWNERTQIGVKKGVCMWMCLSMANSLLFCHVANDDISWCGTAALTGWYTGFDNYCISIHPQFHLHTQHKQFTPLCRSNEKKLSFWIDNGKKWKWCRETNAKEQKNIEIEREWIRMDDFYTENNKSIEPLHWVQHANDKHILLL